MRQRPLYLALALLISPWAWADKIIMKDGKIYQGRIMGESNHALLISNPPVDPKPRFVELRDVLTIVRESRPEETPSAEEQRFASVTAGIGGQLFSSQHFDFSPAPSVYFGGGFRVHPALEVGGELNVTPNLEGSLAVSDGQATRGYEHFYAYDGGFSVKLFPFYKHREWRFEPYVTTGYHWSRLTPKDSGDELKGTSLFGGAGVMIPWWKPLYWDLRLTYEHTRYDTIQFLGGQGDLTGVTNNSYALSVGLSYRFL